jgi:uncharacterized protein YllA (UPF0747 family)
VSDPACLRFPLEHYPGFNRFVLDWLHGDDRFLAHGPRELHARAHDSSLAGALAESNRQWGNDVDADLRRWAAGETATIVAGQQVGFAGGPLYTIVKLATLLKMKRDARVPTTAFFWLATEDHDFNEVANVELPAKNGQRDLASLRAVRHGESRQVVGPQPIPESLIEELLAFFDRPRPAWLRPGITFRDSFAELLTAASAEKVVFVDALLPELRRAGAPLFAQIFDKWRDVQQSIAARSRELENAGYTPQVEARDDEYTLLFGLDEHGNRSALDVSNRDVAPDRISTSALTRPLLQDFALQPDVFVGGPAEVAYYAQIAPLYDLLGIAQPRVALRAHALVAPHRVCRTFDKYGVKPEEIFSGAEAVLAEREPEGVAEIQRVAGEAEKQLAEAMTAIGEIALPAEHAVARRVTRSIGHIEYHFNKLTQRAVSALVRKEKERFDAMRRLVSTLYPDGRVQDRVAAWLPFYCEHGREFVNLLTTFAEADSDFCTIVSI